MSPRAPGRRNRLLVCSISALGISSIITQLTVLRELLGVVAGNELVIGVVLATWLLHTGLGAYLGKRLAAPRRPLLLLCLAQVAIALLPVAHILLIRGLRNSLFIRGEAIGLASLSLSSLALLLPYCLVSGFLLTFACTLFASDDEAASIGEVYFIDNLGDILGGVLFSFILVHVLDVLPILYVAGGLNLACAVVVAWASGRRRLAMLLGAATVAALALVLQADLDRATTGWLFAGEEVVVRRDSRYGSIVLTRLRGQEQLYENGQLLYAGGADREQEELAHLAMAQHPVPQRVLLLGGGPTGMAAHLLAHRPERVDQVELDPVLVEVARRHLTPLEDPRLHLVIQDGRRYVKTTSARYDVVVLDLPPPETTQLNRFYTTGFFREVRRILEPEGVVALSLPGAESYRSRTQRRAYSILRATLRRSFEHVLLVPASTTVFLASDRQLRADPVPVLEARGIQARWVRREYQLPPDLLVERVRQLRDELDPGAPVNRDFTPVLLHVALERWLSRFQFRLWLFLGLSGLVLALYLTRLRAVSFAIFSTGFAAAALELVLVVGFQVLHGYVYLMVGIIFTAFMVGLAAGSFVANRWQGARRPRTVLVTAELALVALAALVGLTLVGLNRTGSTALMHLSAPVIFPGLTLGAGFLVGLEFPVASRLTFRGIAATAGTLYTADLVGACVGAMVVSALLVPRFGLLVVCALVAALKLLSAGILALTSRR